MRETFFLGLAVMTNWASSSEVSFDEVSPHSLLARQWLSFITDLCQGEALGDHGLCFGFISWTTWCDCHQPSTGPWVKGLWVASAKAATWVEMRIKFKEVFYVVRVICLGFRWIFGQKLSTIRMSLSFLKFCLQNLPRHIIHLPSQCLLADYIAIELEQIAPDYV